MEGIWKERFLPLRIPWVISVPGVIRTTPMQGPVLLMNGNLFTTIQATRHIQVLLRNADTAMAVVKAWETPLSVASIVISIMETIIG